MLFHAYKILFWGFTLLAAAKLDLLVKVDLGYSAISSK
ncbi:hypothetical protein B6N60_00204 [Richelia sinica FACHB-800]|uniref:Uncharacterized protein n=1 Tax=Richelia sinica FACHB-800 TaxID=1357546 RepID=A0A975T3J9_9NOST|nr:hypothetical protein B6N60_00204 [Richelia sinica FACHB-800]